ncbi:MAG: FAD:protein FMN transferase [Treponema sp.]|nr:FAD:protein FMN transferase [Treponema sp.]
MKPCASHFIFLALFHFVFILLGCKNRVSGPRVENVIGTVCSVNAFDGGTEELYDCIFQRLREIDALFNVNRSDSLIAQVNASAGKNSVTVNSDFLFVLNKALYYAELSDGLFDPTIGPLVKLWGINTDHAKVPSDKELETVLKLVDWKKVIVKESANDISVFLEKEGMSLDLGGIAKGFAADEITEILKEFKVKSAIVDLGGNVCVFGKKKNGGVWNIGIKNPFEPQGTPALVLSQDSSSTVVTSGVYERFFEEEGLRYHHIFDVRTGYPAMREWSSVTVVAPENHSVDADALSTISFLMGFEKYSSMIDIPVIYINNDKSIQASASLSGKLCIYDWQESDISFE